MRDQGIEPRLPDCPLPYLLDIFMEIGPTGAGGMGPVPISHQEILAWQTNTGICLEPWEVRIVRRLSFEWIAESRRAEDPDSTEPGGTGEISDEQLTSVADALKRDMKRSR